MGGNFMLSKEELKLGAIVIRVPSSKHEKLIDFMSENDIGYVYKVTEIGVNFFSLRMLFDESSKTEYFNPYGENKSYDYFQGLEVNDVVIDIKNNTFARIIDYVPDSDKLVVSTREKMDYTVETRALRKVFDDKAIEKLGFRIDEKSSSPAPKVETPEPVKFRSTFKQEQKQEPVEKATYTDGNKSEVPKPEAVKNEETTQNEYKREAAAGLTDSESVDNTRVLEEKNFNRSVHSNPVSPKSQITSINIKNFNSQGSSVWVNQELVMAFGKKAILDMVSSPISDKLNRNKQSLRELVSLEDYLGVSKIADENTRLNKLIQNLAKEEESILKEIGNILYGDPSHMDYAEEEVVEKALGISLK
jgi:hypothetical protein